MSLKSSVFRLIERIAVPFYDLIIVADKSFIKKTQFQPHYFNR